MNKKINKKNKSTILNLVETKIRKLEIENSKYVYWSPEHIAKIKALDDLINDIMRLSEQ